MKTPTINPTIALSQWAHFSRMIRGFLGVPLSAGLTAALVFVVLMGGCKKEDPGIVNVCIAPTVIRTSPVDGEPNVPLNKTSGTTAGTRVAAVKIIKATFSTPMNPNSITTATFTVQQGTNSISGTVSYSDTTALFVVPNSLGPDLTYTCTITTGVKDVAGTALASNYVWTFTTIAPGTPTLVSPANGAVNQATNPTMIWNAVPGAGTYRLQASLSPGFVSTVYNDSTRTSTSQPISGLSVGTTYYWRVNSKIAGGTSAYSTVWSFTTIAPPAAPVLVAPVAAAQNQATSPTLSWLASTGASTYRLQVSTSSSFATTVYNDSTITGTSRPITGLAIGTTYYWRVNAKNVAGTSAYSTRSFTTFTIVPALQPPTLVAPANAAVNISTSPTLSWNASTGATTYRLQVDTSGVFANTVFDDSTLTGLSQPVASLTNGKTYYWRVNAKNSAGTSAYSTTWHFTVAVLPPPSVILGVAARFGSIGGGAGITNQGTLTQVYGSIGTTGASTLITGFHDGTAPPTNVFTETPLNIGAVRDTIYTADAPPGAGAIATQGLADAQTAFNFLRDLPGGIDVSTLGGGAGELGNRTLAPGVYKSAPGTYGITLGDLTLDAQGDPNALWVFQMASSLTVGIAGPTGARSVILINGAQAKNVFWQVGSAATINGAGGGTMVGTIIAYSGVTFSTHDNTTITSLEGRALGLNASVTMVNTIINVPLP
jgi:Ice-binding-like/Bacterial Ig-like domain